jgi:hypothetical protein
VQLAVAEQGDHPANHAVMPDEDAEHPLHRRLEVEGARQGLAHLEQRREAARVARGGGGIDSRFRGWHSWLLICLHVFVVTEITADKFVVNQRLIEECILQDRLRFTRRIATAARHRDRGAPLAIGGAQELLRCGR